MGYKKVCLYSFTAVTLALLQGCSTTQCDPRDGGFVKGLACLEQYDARVASLQSQYKAQEVQSAKTLATYYKLHEEALYAQARNEVLKAQLYDAQNEIATIRYILAQIQTGAIATSSQSKTLHASLTALFHQLKQIKQEARFTLPLKPPSAGGVKKVITSIKDKVLPTEAPKPVKKLDATELLQIKTISEQAGEETQAISSEILLGINDLEHGTLHIPKLLKTISKADALTSSYLKPLE